MNSYHEREMLIPFRSALLPHIFTDVVIVGTGVAGLRAAIEASQHSDVIVLAKESIDLSNTSWAQGGIAAVMNAKDSINAHIQDTLEAGAGFVRTRCGARLGARGTAGNCATFEMGNARGSRRQRPARAGS